MARKKTAVSDLRNCSNKIVEDVVICQLIGIITAGQVDQVRFNQAEIMRHLLDKLFTIDSCFHLQTVARPLPYKYLLVK